MYNRVKNKSSPYAHLISKHSKAQTTKSALYSARFVVTKIADTGITHNQNNNTFSCNYRKFYTSGICYNHSHKHACLPTYTPSGSFLISITFSGAIILSLDWSIILPMDWLRLVIRILPLLPGGINLATKSGGR